MNATKTVELALWTGDSWELIGNFASPEEAIQAAQKHGPGRYGYSADPLSGQYEETVEVE